MLSKQNRAVLAYLINRLQVCDIMRRSEDLKTREIYRKVEAEVVVELADRFGIELPTLEMMRERMGA